jgi:hypothetical protein
MLLSHVEQLLHVLLPDDVALSEGRSLHSAWDNLSHIMTKHHPYGALYRQHLHIALLTDLPKDWQGGVVSRMKQ